MSLAVAAAAILIGVAAATLAISDHSPALAGSTTSPASAVAPARSTEDVSGPCDEAEHANEARCAATTTTATGGEATTTMATRGEDRAGRRHRAPHGRRGASPSALRPSDDNGDHGGGDDRGHRGGGHGRDHAEDD